MDFGRVGAPHPCKQAISCSWGELQILEEFGRLGATHPLLNWKYVVKKIGTYYKHISSLSGDFFPNLSVIV